MSIYVYIYIYIYICIYIYIYIYIKDFAWEDQREKLCYIGHIAPETCLQCYIVNKHGKQEIKMASPS